MEKGENIDVKKINVQVYSKPSFGCRNKVEINWYCVFKTDKILYFCEYDKHYAGVQ